MWEHLLCYKHPSASSIKDYAFTVLANHHICEDCKIGEASWQSCFSDYIIVWFMSDIAPQYLNVWKEVFDTSNTQYLWCACRGGSRGSGPPLFVDM